MINLYLNALAVMMILGFLTWLYSLYRADVSIVDSLWSLMFLAAGFVYLGEATQAAPRAILILCLLALWALRLSIHLTVRNHDQPEDRRYQQIRSNNQPYFAFKSLYIVFGLQCLLAWMISAPLLFALNSAESFHWIDILAGGLWMGGFAFQAIADWQLYRFNKRSNHANEVLNTGLWAYTRHPNYFGEFCIWWAYYLFAIPADGVFTVYAPLLMTLLLLRVSGVALMEKGIHMRRPGYQRYMEHTNAFFPGRPRLRGDSIA